MGWDLIDDAKRDGITAVQNAQDAAAGRNGKNDPLNNDMQLGGEANGAQNDAERFKGLANGAANTAAPGTNWRGGNAYNSYADSSRNGTQDALSLMRDRANGIHTASDAMANRGNALATAGQGAMIRSGRGAAALAGAGAQTAGIASRMHTDNANNIRVTNAADTAQAQQQLAQGYGQQRAQDASQQHILDARAQYVADLSMRQRGLNDAGQMGYERQAFGANMSGLKGEEALNDAQYADWAQRSNQHEAVAGMDQANAMKYGGAALNGLGQGAGYAYSQGGADPGYDYSDPSNTDINRVNPYTNSDQRVKSDIKDESAAAQYARKVHEILSTKEGSKQFGETLVPTGAPAATERLKERIAASDTGKRLDGAHKATASGLGGFTQGTADKFLEATKGWGTGGDDSKAGYVERVSRAIQKKSNDARHATGADKYDAQPEDAGELGRMPTKGSVKGLLEAQAAKEERERQAELAGMDQSYMARYVREVQAHRDSHGGADPRAMNDNPVEIATESGPMTDSYGRTHKMVEKYGENFYPGFKKDDPTRKDPPKGGDVYANGKWSKAPDPVNPLEQKRLEYEAFVKAHQQAEPTPEAMPAPRPPSASMEMLDHVKPVSFDYKPGFGGPGRHYGVLAQDLEKSPMGASLVHQGPDGVRKVDVAKASMANMAANADLHERVKVLEGGVDRSAQKRERQEGVAPEPTPEPLPAPAPPQETLVASDEVVKDDIRREGIDPKTAYTSRVHELMAMADAGHPEAPRKLLRVEREGERLGLNKAHSSRGDYDSEDQVLGVDKRLMGGVVPGEVKFEDEEDPNDRTLRTLDREQSPQVDPEGWTVAPNKTEAYAAKVRGNLMGIEPNQSQNWGPLASEPAASSQWRDAPPLTPNAHPLQAVSDYAKSVVKGAQMMPEGARQVGQFAKEHAPTVGQALPYSNPMTGIPAAANAGSKALAEKAFGKPPEMKDPLEAPKERPAAEAKDVALPAGAGEKVASTAKALTEQEPEMSMYAGPSTHTVAARYEDLIGPDAWAALSEAKKAAYTAADNITNRHLDQAREDTGLADEHARQAEARGVLALHDKRQAELHGKDVDTLGREFEADAKNLANYHEDPARFWNSRSTGQQIAGLLGVVLGGFAAGMKGGQNAALEQMNRAQDKDIDAQRANFQANKDSVAAKRSAYGMAMERFNHDDNMATAAVRLAGLDKREAEAMKMAAQHSGTETMDRLDKFLADNGQLKADEIIKYKKYHEKLTVQNGQTMYDLQKDYGKYHDSALLALHKGEGGTPPLSFGEWSQSRLGGTPRVPVGAVVGPHTSSGSAGDNPTVHLFGGGEAKARSKTFADDYVQRMEGASEFEAAIQTIVDVRKKGIAGRLSPSDRAAAESAAIVAKNAFVKGEGFKRTPAQTEFEALDRIIPAHGGQFSMTADRQLEEAAKITERWRESAKKNYIVPGSETGAPQEYTPKVGKKVE